MKALTVIFSLLLICFTSSCSIVTVQHDYDPQFNFAGLKSYDWLPIPKSIKINRLNVKRTKRAVDEQMEAKGLKMNAVDPDFLIALHMEKVNKLSVTDWGYGYGRWGRNIDVSQYEEGSIILDFLETKSKNLIWRCVAKAAIDPYPTPEKQEKRIKKAVQEMLINFPPTVSE
jgi:hypothetical protein